jgi:hypothetical protein
VGAAAAWLLQRWAEQQFGDTFAVQLAIMAAAIVAMFGLYLVIVDRLGIANARQIASMFRRTPADDTKG